MPTIDPPKNQKPPPNNASLDCLYQNVRGLRSKTTTFYNSVTVCDFDFIGLTETWLTADIQDSELFPTHFSVYRKDRDYGTLNVTRGGGVLLAVRNRYASVKIDLSNITTTLPEIDIVGVKFHELRLAIFVLYIPPSTSASDYEHFLDLVSTVGTVHNCKVIVMGDFNVPTHIEDKNNYSVLLRNFMQFNNFTQFNNIPNVNNHNLDLVFSNNPCTVTREEHSLVTEDAHHPTLCIELKTAKKHHFEISNARCYDFRKANFPELYSDLQLIDWSYLNETNDVNTACAMFYDILKTTYDKSVPIKKMRANKSYHYPPWFNNEIRTCIRNKWLALNKYNKFKTDYNYNTFKSYRSQLKTLINTEYQRYIQNIQNTVKQDPKKLWTLVQHKKGTTRIPGVMKYADNEISTPKEIVNAFSEYFSGTYILSNPSNIPKVNMEIVSDQLISLPHITEDDIFAALKRSKNSLTTGADGIPSFILKDCAYIFVEPLHHIFNLIRKTNTYPDIWKKAIICPIFKSGESDDVQNYRPISLLCNFSKVLESILYKHIFSSVRHLISPLQHGFMPERSTITNLACFKQYTSEIVDKKGQVDVLYTDFSKAFDKIDHFILLEKLRGFGFSEPLLKLFKSYIMNRQQAVKYNNHASDDVSPTSGVPQGSNLGPLLFLLFINDITENITCEALLFADDLKLYSSIDSISDCSVLQENLETVSVWCTRNRLSLNIGKCRVVTYTRRHNTINYNYNIDNSEIIRSELYKDLGIVFDSKLTFNEHVLEIVAKTSKTYGFIYRNCREFSDDNSLCILYFSLIRSRLEYGALIWFPIYNIYINYLESVQRRFLKFLCFRIDGVYPPRGYDQALLLDKFNFNSLNTRRVIITVKFLYNIFSNHIDCSWLLSKIQFLTPRLNSRHSLVFHCPRSRTSVLSRSPISLMCYNFNKISSYCDIHFDSVAHIACCVVTVFGQ